MPHIREDGGEKALRQGQCRSSNTTIILIVDLYYKYICQLKYRVVTYVWKWDWLVIVLAEIVKHVLNGNRHLCHGHGDRELLGNGGRWTHSKSDDGGLYFGVKMRKRGMCNKEQRG